MKIFFVAFLMMAVTLQSCQGQTGASQELYNKEFNWSIKIPSGFEAVSKEEWTRLQNKGTDAIEKTYDQKIENEATTLFAFRSDRFNYFESNYQPFDPKKDGDYMESFRNVNSVLYGTFEAQMPKAKLDSSSYQETISGKVFNVFKVIIIISDKMTLEMLMYSRLFGNKEFTVNIMTADQEKQKVLLAAWRQSTFGTVRQKQ